MNLKENIQLLLQKKKARYITNALLRDNYPTVLTELMTRTNYLPKDSSMSERMYYVVYDLTSLHHCPNCSKELYRSVHKFDMPIHEYLGTCCSASCSKEYEVTIFKQYVETRIEIISKEDLVKMIDETKPSFKGMSWRHTNSAKYWLKLDNIDYSTMCRSEAFYFLLKGLKERPKCYCGNILNYKNHGEYFKHCSPECSLKSDETKQKRMDTCIDRYGVDNVRKSEEVKKIIRETILNRYGEDNVSKLDKVKEKMRKTILLRFGVDHYSKTEQFKIDTRNSIYKNTYQKFIRFASEIMPLFSEDEFKGGGYEKYYKWKCIKCDNEFQHWYHNGSTPRCPICFPKGYAKSQSNLCEFVKTLDDSVVMNVYTVISPLELDLYCPRSKIAIEFNGLFWHSHMKGGKHPRYHLEKTLMCETIDLRLIHVFEDEWNNKKHCVRNTLRRIFGKTRFSIDSSRCEVREVSGDVCDRFLDKWHLQGKDKISTYKYGLYFKNRLVSVMTFYKVSKKDCHVLSRFAEIGSFRIVGGAKCLLQRFLEEVEPEKVMAYSDLRWYRGGFYEELGFNLRCRIEPNCWYTRDYLKRVSIYNRETHFKYDKLHDCGMLVYCLKKKSS